MSHIPTQTQQDRFRLHLEAAINHLQLSRDLHITNKETNDVIDTAKRTLFNLVQMISEDQEVTPTTVRASDAAYLAKLEAADEIIADLTGTLKMPGHMNGQAEDFRAELMSEIQHLTEEEPSDV